MQTEPLELNSYAVRLDIMYLAPRCRSAFDSGLSVTPVSLAITKCQLYGFGLSIYETGPEGPELED